MCADHVPGSRGNARLKAKILACLCSEENVELTAAEAIEVLEETVALIRNRHAQILRRVSFRVFIRPLK